MSNIPYRHAPGRDDEDDASTQLAADLHARHGAQVLDFEAVAQDAVNRHLAQLVPIRLRATAATGALTRRRSWGLLAWHGEIYEHDRLFTYLVGRVNSGGFAGTTWVGLGYCQYRSRVMSLVGALRR